jgi:hypothetical protein
MVAVTVWPLAGCNTALSPSIINGQLNDCVVSAFQCRVTYSVPFPAEVHASAKVAKFASHEDPSGHPALAPRLIGYGPNVPPPAVAGMRM